MIKVNKINSQIQERTGDRAEKERTKNEYRTTMERVRIEYGTEREWNG